MYHLQECIEKVWEDPTVLTLQEKREVITAVLDALDEGQVTVVSEGEEGWVVHEWVKKAILLSFRVQPSKRMTHLHTTSNQTAYWYDKCAPKFLGWTSEQFDAAKLRVVPGGYVRHGAYIGKNVVLMPSFVNVGAFVGEGTMVDTWATIGCCAYVGKNCHISGGVGIGGVLEPLQAKPVIIEKNCFIGARSEIAEGIRIGAGSVIGMGVYIGASTRIIDRQTGEVRYGEIPAGSVVVAGSFIQAGSPIGIYAAIIVKTVDAQTRSKTAINALLRYET